MDVGGAGLIEDGWKNRRTHHEENADKSLTTRKFLVSTVSLNVGYRKNSAYHTFSLSRVHLSSFHVWL